MLFPHPRSCPSTAHALRFRGGLCSPPAPGRPRRELGPAPLQFPGPGVRTPLRTRLVSGGARGTRGAPLPAPGPSQRLPVSPHTPGRWRGDTAGRRLPGSRRSPARPQVRAVTPRGRALQSGTPGHGAARGRPGPGSVTHGAHRPGCRTALPQGTRGTHCVLHWGKEEFSAT